MAHAELATDKKYHNILYKHKQSNKLQMTLKICKCYQSHMAKLIHLPFA